MDWFIEFFTLHASYAHWVMFGCLMLAGLNLPISEDLVLVASGVLASTVIPENTHKLFLGVFAGAYLSDWMSYWIGRGVGPGIWQMAWLRKLMSKRKINRVRRYYQEYGVTTLLVGRFIPFGVRNALFMTAGMVKMPFGRFVIADGFACFLSNSAVFWLAYAFGKNYSSLKSYMTIFDIFVFAVFVVVVFTLVWYKKFKRQPS